MTLDLDIGQTGRTGWPVAGQRTGVFAASRSGSLAGGLALLTVDPGTELVHRLPDLVAVSLTAVVPAGQSSATLTAAGGRLRGVAGPGGGLVASWTGHTHWVLTGGAGGGLRPVLRSPLLPGPHWPGPCLHLDPDILVTGGGAGVGAGEQLGALLPAGRTGPAVTEMFGPLGVMTLR